ncbi:thioredoxin-like 4, chloroplastic [Magnolia sinica]|uniref:thioredoxin-like 4, chloroplastic n=1 Tax=Magnolia sinica TaxID=86752 RepID=UPI0026598824|nr:thioredoxin-like 4, chloroplastic [Magnolia sinica]XP_058097146.1 thioredoxin-like 4, chloroplastic [Magnolia sinica]XP_058097147.1 thioredoxin-like 4, chloroplastic [Magnolia sinica]XP_058097148.1 thioredoxin-like 4, chloroplastic [Magnolia sinica]XP_058097149.1 thioredoxin-like 4, chloroplastic [Magnolia sinica]XP_058097150.1 thioredoxin-like 4, chloroplastic [Magnolia sinica]XP_058097151.1 thioredoxin-like 4, chloroplastic [Magnolia sinica]
MQRQSSLYRRASFNVTKITDGLHDSRVVCALPSLLDAACQNHIRFWLLRAKIPSILRSVKLDRVKTHCSIQASDFKSTSYENEGELSDADEDDELCPVECVREFKTDKEFCKILERSKETDSLVVVDFYRTSCGSCKYIEQGFAKLCKRSGDHEAPVIFLKHNVIDEYDEQSEVAERLRVKSVPLFHFYKNGVLLEAFPTRDKERIVAAILKYTGLTPEDL